MLFPGPGLTLTATVEPQEPCDVRLTAEGWCHEAHAHTQRETRMNDGSRQACETSFSLLCVVSRPPLWPALALLACVCKPARGDPFPARFPNLTGRFHLVHCVPTLDRFHVIVHNLKPSLCNATPRKNNMNCPLGCRGVLVCSGVIDELWWRET